jgi:hypothetical protein
LLTAIGCGAPSFGHSDSHPKLFGVTLDFPHPTMQKPNWLNSDSRSRSDGQKFVVSFQPTEIAKEPATAKQERPLLYAWPLRSNERYVPEDM